MEEKNIFNDMENDINSSCLDDETKKKILTNYL